MVARRSPKPQARVRLPTRLPNTEYSTAWFSALVLGTRGRRFESYYSDHIWRAGRVWLNAPDLKSDDGKPSGGSNPSPSANIGEWPNGRATGFDPVDCRFESYFPSQYVSVAEWLRSGLQIHVYRFDSCRSLHFRLTTAQKVL